MKPSEVILGQSVWWVETYWRVMGINSDRTLLLLARPTHRQDGTVSFAEDVVDDVPVEFVSPHDSYPQGER